MEGCEGKREGEDHAVEREQEGLRPDPFICPQLSFLFFSRSLPMKSFLALIC